MLLFPQARPHSSWNRELLDTGRPPELAFPRQVRLAGKTRSFSAIWAGRPGPRNKEADHEKT
ncbi:MAG: hypothetical protein A2Y69_13405 [Candidatus Aminicenantes bacterium RBG_13_59_9]|nr:MAG: hypothetical protein A2Y69_13405 [Candidatus Aminicenantes bacterium RBG_13_59_9]